MSDLVLVALELDLKGDKKFAIYICDAQLHITKERNYHDQLNNKDKLNQTTKKLSSIFFFINNDSIFWTALFPTLHLNSIGSKIKFNKFRLNYASTYLSSPQIGDLLLQHYVLLFKLGVVRQESRLSQLVVLQLKPHVLDLEGCHVLRLGQLGVLLKKDESWRFNESCGLVSLSKSFNVNFQVSS